MLLAWVVQAPLAAAQQGPLGDRGTSVIAKSNTHIDDDGGDEAPGPPPAAEAVAASVTGDAARSTFKLTLTAGVQAEIFTLPSPYRVIIDLPDVSFRLPPATGEQPQGLVKAFRYGLFAEGKARVVIDTLGPVRVDKAAMTAAGKGVVLAFDLIATDSQTFGSGTGAARAERAPHPVADEPADRRAHKARPVIMIDPGHGGIDAGAVGATKLLEKNIVLAVGKELKRQLSASGRYDVRMTRSTDVFISLDNRIQASRAADADLFISLHADSLAGSGFAGSIRGATVYTLSERASDEQTRLMAEKENASDLVAGLSAGDGEGSDEVKTILFDLMRRENANFSADFSNVLVSKLRRNIALSRDPQRSAAFKVLKQAHAPSVLVELGYLSHSGDESLMNSPDWQRKAAASIATAVDTYFAKRRAAAP